MESHQVPKPGPVSTRKSDPVESLKSLAEQGDMNARDELVRFARSGDAYALELLMEIVRPKLRNAANQRRTASSSDAANDALICCYQGFSTFTGKTFRQFEGWMIRIAKNRAIDISRKNRRPGTVSTDREANTPMECQLLAADTSPDNRAIRQEQSIRLHDALSKLPEHYREVIQLKSLDEMSMAEVARRMDKTIPAASQLHYRAMEQLRKMMKGTHE